VNDNVDNNVNSNANVTVSALLTVTDEALVTLGLDLGSLFTKAALLVGGDSAHVEGELLASEVIPTTGTVADQLGGLIEALLASAGLSSDRLDGIVATGRGAALAPDVDFAEESMACIGAAVRRLLPGVEIVLDVGGQSITAIRLDGAGAVVDFMRNDKCASGTGRYLEVMGQALGVSIEALDGCAALARQVAPISSQCGVFVESEVITHLNDGVAPEAVAAGLCEAVARTVVSQARRFCGGAPETFSITGGVARLEAVVRRVREQLGGGLVPFPLDPLLAAAYGAAVLAAEAEEA